MTSHIPDKGQVMVRPTSIFIDYLNLTLAAEKPPPSHIFEQVALMAAEENGEYGITGSGSLLSFSRGGVIPCPDWTFGRGYRNH